MLSPVSKLTLRPTLSRPCSQAGFRPHKAGVDLILLEAGDWAGGRMTTDTVDGYVIERGSRRSGMAGLGVDHLGNLADSTSVDRAR